MNFDVFENDPVPPAPASAAGAMTEGRRRRARRRMAASGVASALALAVGVTALRSPGPETRPVLADQSDGGRACRLADLSVSSDGVGVAAGTWGDRILFRNVGTSVCTLTGYPTVTGNAATGEKRADQTEIGMIPSTKGAGSVELRRGETAEAVVEGANVPSGDAVPCVGVVFPSLTIAVPGDADTLQLLGSWNDCGRLEVHQFAPHSKNTRCDAHFGDAVAVTTIREQSATSGDGVNDRFEPPGDEPVGVSAQEAAATAVAYGYGLAAPVDAVLAQWTQINVDGGPRLIWIVRNQYVSVASSRGGDACGETAYFVDATTGQVLEQRSAGTRILPEQPTTTSTAPQPGHRGGAELSLDGVVTGPLQDAEAVCIPRPDASSELRVTGAINGDTWFLSVLSYAGETGVAQVIAGHAGGGTGLEGQGYAVTAEYPSVVAGVDRVDWAHGATLDVTLTSQEGQQPAGNLVVRGTITCE